MRPAFLLGAAAVLGAALLAAAACAGGEDGARAPTTQPAAPAAAGVAGCWKDAAVTAKDAADEAGTVLPGQVTRVRTAYADLRSAAARGDSAAFQTARGAFFQALSRMSAGGDRFEGKNKRAGASIAACTKADPQVETVEACWRSVASTYGESLIQADEALGPLGGTLYVMVDRLTGVIENGEPEAVLRAERRFFSAALRVQQAANRYAASHDRGGELYEQCAAA